MGFECHFLFAFQLPHIHKLILSARSDEFAIGTKLCAEELPIVIQFTRNPRLFDIECRSIHIITSLMGSHSSFAMASFWPLWR